MHVRVLIERHMKPGKEEEALDRIKEMRKVAVTQPGYVSGETLTDTNDPRTIIIVSTWHALGEWQRWESSDQHQSFAASIGQLLEEPASVRIFVNPWDALNE